MTTDSEAWVLFQAASMSCGTILPEAAAVDADKALVLYRERQKRGDFGAPSGESDAARVDRLGRMVEAMRGERDAALEAADRWEKEAAEQRVRAGALDRQGSAAYNALTAMRARAEAAERERDEGVAREKAVSAARDHYARQESIEEDAKLAAESLLKEALAAHVRISEIAHDADREGPHADGRFIPIWSASDNVLSMARAQGYLPDGEVTT